MAVTQQEIADELGISRQIVGQALSGHPRVAAATRLRVEREAIRRGYHTGSNREARALIARRYGKRVKTGIIMVAFTSVFHGESMAASPLLMPTLAGIQARGRHYDWDVLSCSADEEQLPRLVQDGEVDGVVCYMAHSFLQRIQALGLPLVAVGMWNERAPCILADGRTGIAQATNHLIGLGHRRIGYLGFHPHFDEAERRLDGYRFALRGAGLEPMECLHPDRFAGPSIEAGNLLAGTLLKRNDFTALVCYNDMMAMGAIRKLQEAGLSVPDDISVTGFDNVAQDYGFRPALTSVGFDKFALGSRAVDLLRDASKRETEDASAKSDTIDWRPTEMVIRESTMTPRR